MDRHRSVNPPLSCHADGFLLAACLAAVENDAVLVNGGWILATPTADESSP